MSCLHPYSEFVVNLRSRWTVFCLATFFLLLASWHAEAQNVLLEFPVFNDSTFTCTGIPTVVGYNPCFYTTTAGDAVEILPPEYNNIYPNQAARYMYSTPVLFYNPTASVQASFNTFFIFSVMGLNTSVVGNQSNLGAGFAFMVAPEINTPANSASGGFGMFPIIPTTGQPSSPPSTVIGVEFDTFFTPGIDTVPVPHIGIDISALGGSTGNNATQVGPEFLNTTVGMWIFYNSTETTLEVYAIPVDATNISAIDLQPDNAIVAMSGLVLSAQLNRRCYIGFGAGVYGGGFEINTLYYWVFETFGFPPVSLLAQWYQWWAPLSTTKKLALIAGAVIGTVGGAYACSECLFFCFFKRIKNPQTPQEERWPVRRRKSLPGTRTKKVPPRKKVRDSLSVANPLHLWEAPLEPAEDPDNIEESQQQSPTSEIEEEDSDPGTEDTPLMSPPDIEMGHGSEDEAIEEVVQTMKLSKHGKRSQIAARRKPSPTRQVQVSPPAKEIVVPRKVQERTPSPAKMKSAPEMQKKPSSPSQQRPPRVPQKPSQGVQQAAKPSSPPPSQRRPSQTPAREAKKVAPQEAKPVSAPKDGGSKDPKKTVPPQNVAVRPAAATKRPSPPKQMSLSPPQGRNPSPPKGRTPSPPKGRTPSPPKRSVPATTAAGSQKSQPKPVPRPLPKKESLKGPRPSPERSPQTSPPKAVPPPRPKSPPRR
ncbi:unnamed protein product [Calypogeia fissa]